ncbi:hypothetical protein LTR94_026792, partial [Friedmanniomyces endolithicus]
MTDAWRPSAETPSLIALWHACWAVAMSITAFAAQTFAQLPDTVLAALLLMALPGVAGVSLMVRDAIGLRFGLMGGWLMASTAAAGLTGGATGALPGLLVMPLAAGVVLDHAKIGDDRLTRIGQASLVLPLISGLISTLLNGATAQAP